MYGNQYNRTPTTRITEFSFPTKVITKDLMLYAGATHRIPDNKTGTLEHSIMVEKVVSYHLLIP